MFFPTKTLVFVEKYFDKNKFVAKFLIIYANFFVRNSCRKIIFQKFIRMSQQNSDKTNFWQNRFEKKMSIKNLSKILFWWIPEKIIDLFHLEPKWNKWWPYKKISQRRGQPKTMIYLYLIWTRIWPVKFVRILFHFVNFIKCD